MFHIDPELKRTLPKFEFGVDFCSNDYLGMVRNNEVRKALVHFLQVSRHIGSTGSRLISGNSRHIEELEYFLAQTFGANGALLFGSGYLANIGVLAALGGDETIFFSDALNHASMIDGICLSRSRKVIFNHCDMDHLEHLLATHQAKHKVIVIESVFSMDGDSPDIPALMALCQKFDAYLVIDEAHATFVCGHKGLGLMHGVVHGCNPERIIVIHTCSKALGAYGAFVTCGADMHDFFINKARSFIYSTALPPVMIAHIDTAIRLLQHSPRYRKHLTNNVATLKRLFLQHRLHFQGSHIVVIKVPGNQRVLAAAENISRYGIKLKAIRSPTVPVGSERLRLTIKAFHTPDDLLCATEAIAQTLA